MVKCVECKFWCTKSAHYKGECRANPPLSYQGVGYWPITKDTDGCFTGQKKEQELINE